MSGATRTQPTAVVLDAADRVDEELRILAELADAERFRLSPGSEAMLDLFALLEAVADARRLAADGYFEGRPRMAEHYVAALDRVRETFRETRWLMAQRLAGAGRLEA